MTLFDAGLEQTLATSGPLATRLRPRTLDDLVGQRHLLGAGSPLRRLVEGGGTTSVLLWGPPGSGKTTLAHIISGSGGRRFRELSAVTAGVKDVRAVIDQARDALAVSGVRTVLFIDEVHRFTRTQQDALLPAVESGLVTLVAATTENPFFSIVAPLLSRSLLLTLEPLAEDDLRVLVQRALDDQRGYGGRLTMDPDAVTHLLRLAGGDARRVLTALQAAGDAALAAAAADPGTGAHPETGAGSGSGPGEGRVPVCVDLATLEQAVNRAAVRYDRDGDQHYDVASALIKSVRGSDVDAALHYLARMLEAGEDPRFVARRMIILASEDVGLAEPGALGVAVAAAQALETVGLPEARLALAQAVIHLALAPKSNAVIRAVDAAVADVRAGRGGPVPPHLRDTHYPGASRLGHGSGYRYPHDYPGAVVGQQYAPDPLVGSSYYQPSEHGFELRAGQRLAFLRETLRGTGEPAAARGESAAAGGEPTGARADVDEPSGASDHEAGRAR
ncbi:replication-associated recombination protein A [Protofrankia symbiont of Coriaria ruscifolia]|uniref:replication-associated recombination protein A n=1 Tax=Protofrankia symbiont of Coriaria ruscifolia TaxID=1306542 RepID=UPI0010419725|nr:replication-associated recombination protein A [Protofrankia symbiont of Coriaria ruscifolia]